METMEIKSKIDFTAGCDEDKIGIGIVADHISTPGDIDLCGLFRSIGTEILTGAKDNRGAFGLEACSIAMCNFMRLGGTVNGQAGDGAEHGDLLNGFMGGAVFAHIETVVGEDIEFMELHESCETDGGLHVVAEDKEC